MDFELIKYVLVVIAIIVAGIIFLKRDNILPGKYSSKKLKLREVLFLDPQRKLILITKGRKEYTILIGKERETLIDTAIIEEEKTKELEDELF